MVPSSATMTVPDMFCSTRLRNMASPSRAVCSACLRAVMSWMVPLSRSLAIGVATGFPAHRDPACLAVGSLKLQINLKGLSAFAARLHGAVTAATLSGFRSFAYSTALAPAIGGRARISDRVRLTRRSRRSPDHMTSFRHGRPAGPPSTRHPARSAWPQPSRAH